MEVATIEEAADLVKVVPVLEKLPTARPELMLTAPPLVEKVPPAPPPLTFTSALVRSTMTPVASPPVRTSRVDWIPSVAPAKVAPVEMKSRPPVEMKLPVALTVVRSTSPKVVVPLPVLVKSRLRPRIAPLEEI